MHDAQKIEEYGDYFNFNFNFNNDNNKDVCNAEDSVSGITSVKDLECYISISLILVCDGCGFAIYAPQSWRHCSHSRKIF